MEHNAWLRNWGAPDTSPRCTEAESIQGARDHWDFGVGAGFYLDAVQEPWARHWRMESYLMAELLPAITDRLPIDADRLGIFGCWRRPETEPVGVRTKTWTTRR